MTAVNQPGAEDDLALLAFEQAPVGLVVSENRVIRRCNRAFERMFGYEPGELDEVNFERLYASTDAFVKIAARGVPDLRQTSSYWDERVMLRKDGTRFWCRVRGRTLTPEEPFRRAVWSFADLSGHRPYQPMAPRERDVAMLLARGLTSKEIARELGISPRTIEVHRARLHRKFGVSNTNALVSTMSGVPPERIVDL